MSLISTIKKLFNKEPTSASPTSISLLSDEEIRFLAYADGHDADVKTFSQFYKYKCGINDYTSTLKKLSINNYLTITVCEKSLELYKVDELKSYLKSYNLSTSGKKADLIQRIIDNTPDYPQHFTKKVCILTEKGENTVNQYTAEHLEAFKNQIHNTIVWLRTNDTQSIINEYASEEWPDAPFALPYNAESVTNDVRAIQEYRNLGHDTDRELSICIISLMFHRTFKDTLKLLADIGYNDISDSELYTVQTSLCSLRTINSFKEANLEKYQISTCGDGRTCPNCAKMDQKIFPVSQAVLGKNLPPFCDKCRCIVLPYNPKFK